MLSGKENTMISRNPKRFKKARPSVRYINVSSRNIISRLLLRWKQISEMIEENRKAYLRYYQTQSLQQFAIFHCNTYVIYSYEMPTLSLLFSLSETSHSLFCLTKRFSHISIEIYKNVTLVMESTPWSFENVTLSSEYVI